MTGNQMMDYYVRPRHIYSHSRSFNHSGSCRRPSSLVAFHVRLPPWSFQCSWDINSHDLILVYIRYLHLLWRSWSVVYLHSLWRSWSIVYLHPLWRFWSVVYCMWWWQHMSHFVYHAYSWPLYSYVSGTTICICSHMQRLIIVLYWWVAGSSTWVFITPLLGWIL